MAKKTYLVFTTINIPKIAEDYCNNFEKFDHKDEVGIIVIGDKKSLDLESFSVCNNLQKRGFDIEYFSIEKQEKWLASYNKLRKIIPYNSDNRRNVGFLIALAKGCDSIISTDDDNFPLQEIDFLGYHGIVGTKQKLPVVKTNSNWFNVCDLLKKNPEQRIYPRGYPYNKRWQDTSITQKEKEVQIMLNEGLWLNDPDIDSITRLNRDVKTTEFIGKQIALDIGTWSPINSQNTSFYTELLPAYYFFLMEEKLDDLVINRYGDIWEGLFVKKVMDSLGYYVAFGNPIANHIRNKHNLFKDLKEELGCIIYTDLLVDVLEDINLKSEDVVDLSSSLSNQLLKYTSEDKRFSKDFNIYMKKLNYNQKVWLETIQKIKR